MHRPLRALVAAALALAAHGNEENACDRSQLPWDLDLLEWVESEKPNEELHITGEYLFYKHGEEVFDENVGGVRHTMKVCDPCTDDAYFRYALSPSEHYDMSILLRKGPKEGGRQEVVTASTEGGQNAEKSIFAKLEKDNSYYVDVIYNFVSQNCTAAFIELAFKYIPEGEQVKEVGCMSGSPPYDKHYNTADFDLYSTQLAAGTKPKNEYIFEVDPYKPATAQGKELGYDGFVLRAPDLVGHDGQWRFVLEIRSEFLLGGDITAIVSTSEEKPTLQQCGVGSVVCAFGARGRLKNSYIIDMTVRSGDRWHVHFFRRAPDSDYEWPMEPHCASYSFKASLRAESLQENFISCEAVPLPDNLNTPGYYDAHTGEMALDEDVLLAEDKRTQRALLTPSFNSLFKMTLFHEKLDVALQLDEAPARDDGSAPSDWTKVISSDGILRPEGIAHELEKGKVYRITVTHEYDYVIFDAGWKPHCNFAWMRMEVMKLPLPDYLKIDDQIDYNGAAGGGNNAPPLNFSALTLGQEFAYTNLKPVFLYEKKAGSMGTSVVALPETIAEWEFEITGNTRTFQAHVPHNYITGDVTASVVKLHSSSVQLTRLTFEDGDGRELDAVNIANPGANSPQGEDASNLKSRDIHKKWLDHAKGGVQFDFGEPKDVQKLKFITGNDHLERDPVRFVVLGSNNDPSYTVGMTKDELVTAGATVLLEFTYDYDFPTIRSFPTEPVALTNGGSYRYVIFIPTKMRDYDPFEDIIYSGSDLSGSVLSADLDAGRYRFTLSTGWEIMSEQYARSASLQHHIAYGIDVRIRADACPYIPLPRDLGHVARRSYLFGDYRIEKVGSEADNTMRIAVRPVEASMLNLDVVRTDLKVESIVVDGGGDGAVQSEDYYRNGLHWLMAKLEAGQDYTITFTFEAPEEGEAQTCVGMGLQMSVAALPTATEEFNDLPSLESLRINSPDTGAVQMPFHLEQTFAFNAEKQQHIHHEMHLTEAAEIRVILNYHFEFLHMYIDVCKCADTEYQMCHECGAGRGYSIYNGNHLDAQGLEAGYYILKFYETSFSEKTENRVRNQNAFLVTVHVEPLNKNIDEIALCGHQIMEGSLNGPGLLSDVSIEPWTYHSSSEHLVPEAHAGKRVSVFQFRTDKESIFRMWLPMKDDLSFTATLYKLVSNEGREDSKWPEGSLPGQHGVRKSGDAIYVLIPAARYKVVIEFHTRDPRECLTYDMELSVTPIPQAEPVETKCSAKEDSTFPTTMNSHSHDFRHHSLPADGKNVGSRFRHVIPFSIESVEGGRVWVDLRSTFEFGGLSAYVARKEAQGTPLLYPIRYLHRDYITQDLHGPAEYVLVVFDMASKEDNVALKQYVTCNRYNIHISVTDYADEKDASCRLDFHEELPEAPIADAETARTLKYYNNLQMPGNGDGGEWSLRFKLGSGVTLVKFLTHTHSGAAITSTMWGPSGMEVAHSVTQSESPDGEVVEPDANTALLSTYAYNPGDYEIKVNFDVSSINEVTSESTCDEKIIFSTFDIAVGVLSDALDDLHKICDPVKATNAPPPADLGTLTAALNPGSAYRDFVLVADDQHKFNNAIDMTVDEGLVGGHFYIVVKYNWFLGDMRMALESADKHVRHEGDLDIDPFEESRYSAILTIHRKIQQAGRYTLTLDGVSSFRDSTAGCMPIYFAIVAAPAESDHAEIEAVDPWVAHDIVPTEPLVVRLVLSSHATASSVKKKAAYLLASDNESSKIYPFFAEFDGSPTVIKLGFHVEYAKSYRLVLAADQLKNTHGKVFSSKRVDYQTGVMTYSTTVCSCHDKVHCDWGSSCGVHAQCPCTQCLPGSLPLAGEKICRENMVPETPLPTSRWITPPPTPAPPTSVPTTPAPPGAPASTPLPPSTPSGGGGSKPGGLTPDTPSTPTIPTPTTPTTPASGAGGDGISNVVLVIVVFLVLLGLVLAHRQGYIELPLLPKAQQLHHVQMADTFDEDDADDDADDVGGGGGGGASAPVAAAPAPAAAPAAADPPAAASAVAVEMDPVGASSPEVPAAATPAAAAEAPAAAAPADDPFFDGLFAAAPKAPERRADV